MLIWADKKQGGGENGLKNFAITSFVLNSKGFGTFGSIAS